MVVVAVAAADTVVVAEVRALLIWSGMYVSLISTFGQVVEDMAEEAEAMAVGVGVVVMVTVVTVVVVAAAAAEVSSYFVERSPFIRIEVPHSSLKVLGDMLDCRRRQLAGQERLVNPPAPCPPESVWQSGRLA